MSDVNKQNPAVHGGSIKLSTIIAIVLPLAADAQTTNFLSPSNPPPLVQLGWNATQAIGVTNYYIYEGTNSLQYTSKIAAGTNTTLTVTNLVRGITAYFNITAEANGLESAFGGEVNYTPIAPPASPSLKPIVVLTVQNSPSLSPPQWSTLSTISLTASQQVGFYRTSLTVTAPFPPPLQGFALPEVTHPPAIPQ